VEIARNSELEFGQTINSFFQIMLRSIVTKSFPLTIAGVGCLVSSCNEKSAHCNEELKAFSPKEFRSFKIHKIRDLTHNTKAFEVDLPSPQHEMVTKIPNLCVLFHNLWISLGLGGCFLYHGERT